MKPTGSIKFGNLYRILLQRHSSTLAGYIYLFSLQPLTAINNTIPLYINIELERIHISKLAITQDFKLHKNIEKSKLS